MDDFQKTSSTTPHHTINTPTKTEAPPTVSKPVIIFAIIVVILIVGVIGYSIWLRRQNTEISTDNFVEGVESTITQGNQNISDGIRYKDYHSSLAGNSSGKKIILFFTADWCISCRMLDVEIRNSADSIPENLIIMKVDYDSSTELVEKYRIENPGTFLVVDQEQQELKRFANSKTLNELLLHIP